MKIVLPLDARLRVGVLGAALLACALPAAARTAAAPSAPATAPATAAAPAMSIAQMIEHLSARGYREIKEVERKSDKLFEVKTRDAKGLWVELEVDARSGEVLRSELDD